MLLPFLCKMHKFFIIYISIISYNVKNTSPFTYLHIKNKGANAPLFSVFLNAADNFVHINAQILFKLNFSNVLFELFKRENVH